MSILYPWRCIHIKYEVQQQRIYNIALFVFTSVEKLFLRISMIFLGYSPKMENNIKWKWMTVIQKRKQS